MGRNDSHKNRLLIIKGPFCFVYSGEQALAPKYALGLYQMNADVNASTVLIKTHLGDVHYEVNFDSKEDANIFSRSLKKQASSAHTEEMRKQLGHGGLLNKRASVRYAETIAMDKVKDQPDKPLSTTEVMENIPGAALY